MKSEAKKQAEYAVSEAAKQVSFDILNALGGGNSPIESAGKLRKQIGANGFGFVKNTTAFRFSKRTTKFNACVIEADETSFKMTLFRVAKRKRVELQEFSGLQIDDLKATFEAATGLQITSK
jgi:hypothetical protein